MRVGRRFIKLIVCDLESALCPDIFAVGLMSVPGRRPSGANHKKREEMKRFYAFHLCAMLLIAAGCSDGLGVEDAEDGLSDYEMGHEMIELGLQLEDPYSVKNITKAVAALYPTKAAGGDITPTDKYVRFLPDTEEDMDRLHALGLDLMDHPLDYQIVKDGDYYHDPLLDAERITWQYAVVPHDFELPEGIRCEILDECYIPSEETKSDDGIDWAAVERKAFELTGNGDLLGPETKRERSSPQGRITIVDESANGGKPFGVAGVKVVCNSFVKFSTAYTDRDGYYQISKKYASKVRYRLMFKNSEKFAIGLNLILFGASMSALGKAGPEGLDYTVTAGSDRKLFCRSVVNNAVYDYIMRCGEDDLGINRPPEKLRIWIFQKLSKSCSPMLRHGTLLDQGLFADYLGEYADLIKIFLPDIALGLKGAETYEEIYRRTAHELAHSSHFASVGKSWWGKYVKYLLKVFVQTLDLSYGDGTGDNAGYCEVAEMWAYFLQEILYSDRYGVEMSSSGLTYWFRPQIFRYLYDRGFTVARIFKALTEDADDAQALKGELRNLYPDDAETIEQVFSRYSD